MWTFLQFMLYTFFFVFLYVERHSRVKNDEEQ